MAQELKIEKKASEVIQPETEAEARQAIRSRKDLSGADLHGLNLQNLNTAGAILRKTNLTGGRPVSQPAGQAEFLPCEAE